MGAHALVHEGVGDGDHREEVLRGEGAGQLPADVVLLVEAEGFGEGDLFLGGRVTCGRGILCRWCGMGMRVIGSVPVGREGGCALSGSGVWSEGRLVRGLLGEWLIADLDVQVWPAPQAPSWGVPVRGHV